MSHIAESDIAMNEVGGELERIGNSGKFGNHLSNISITWEYPYDLHIINKE